jgi:hypothetical protein
LLNLLLLYWYCLLNKEKRQAQERADKIRQDERDRAEAAAREKERRRLEAEQQLKRERALKAAELRQQEEARLAALRRVEQERLERERRAAEERRRLEILRKEEEARERRRIEEERLRREAEELARIKDTLSVFPAGPWSHLRKRQRDSSSSGGIGVSLFRARPNLAAKGLREGMIAAAAAAALTTTATTTTTAPAVKRRRDNPAATVTMVTAPVVPREPQTFFERTLEKLKRRWHGSHGGRESSDLQDVYFQPIVDIDSVIAAALNGQNRCRETFGYKVLVVRDEESTCPSRVHPRHVLHNALNEGEGTDVSQISDRCRWVLCQFRDKQSSGRGGRPAAAAARQSQCHSPRGEQLRLYKTEVCTKQASDNIARSELQSSKTSDVRTPRLHGDIEERVSARPVFNDAGLDTVTLGLSIKHVSGASFSQPSGPNASPSLEGSQSILFLYARTVPARRGPFCSDDDMPKFASFLSKMFASLADKHMRHSNSAIVESVSVVVVCDGDGGRSEDLQSAYQRETDKMLVAMTGLYKTETLKSAKVFLLDVPSPPANPNQSSSSTAVVQQLQSVAETLSSALAHVASCSSPEPNILADTLVTILKQGVGTQWDENLQRHRFQRVPLDFRSFADPHGGPRQLADAMSSYVRGYMDWYNQALRSVEQGPLSSEISGMSYPDSNLAALLCGKPCHILPSGSVEDAAADWRAYYFRSLYSAKWRRGDSREEWMSKVVLPPRGWNEEQRIRSLQQRVQSVSVHLDMEAMVESALQGLSSSSADGRCSGHFITDTFQLAHDMLQNLIHQLTFSALTCAPPHMPSISENSLCSLRVHVLDLLRVAERKSFKANGFQTFPQHWTATDEQAASFFVGAIPWRRLLENIIFSFLESHWKWLDDQLNPNNSEGGSEDDRRHLLPVVFYPADCKVSHNLSWQQAAAGTDALEPEAQYESLDDFLEFVVEEQAQLAAADSFELEGGIHNSYVVGDESFQHEAQSLPFPPQKLKRLRSEIDLEMLKQAELDGKLEAWARGGHADGHEDERENPVMDFKRPRVSDILSSSMREDIGSGKSFSAPQTPPRAPKHLQDALEELGLSSINWPGRCNIEEYRLRGRCFKTPPFRFLSLLTPLPPSPHTTSLHTARH